MSWLVGGPVDVVLVLDDTDALLAAAGEAGLPPLRAPGDTGAAPLGMPYGSGGGCAASRSGNAAPPGLPYGSGGCTASRSAEAAPGWPPAVARRAGSMMAALRAAHRAIKVKLPDDSTDTSARASAQAGAGERMWGCRQGRRHWRRSTAAVGGDGRREGPGQEGAPGSLLCDPSPHRAHDTHRRALLQRARSPAWPWRRPGAPGARLSHLWRCHRASNAAAGSQGGPPERLENRAGRAGLQRQITQC